MVRGLVSCFRSVRSQPNAWIAHLNTSGEGDRAGTMTDWLNLGMLIGAAIGSMAFGILAAYWILRTGFALMRPHRRPVAVKAEPEAARVI